MMLNLPCVIVVMCPVQDGMSPPRLLAAGPSHEQVSAHTDLETGWDLFPTH